MELRQLETTSAPSWMREPSAGRHGCCTMTQPPLSYQIKMLEEELQVPLLIRGTKKITTDRGRKNTV
ncbi:MAG: LysR family transcriptional regulator [Fusicatenibacter saccharivorans]